MLALSAPVIGLEMRENPVNRAAEPFVIRPAAPSDAERLIAHAQNMADEAARWLPLQREEFQISVDEERAILSKAAESENSLFLVAEVNRDIVGVLSYSGGRRKATRHVASLGLSVRAAWQGHGVGTDLLTEAIRRAKESGCIRRLELYVYADNERAIRLYKRLGFVTEGVREKAVLREGQYIDELAMALLW